MSAQKLQFTLPEHETHHVPGYEEFVEGYLRDRPDERDMGTGRANVVIDGFIEREAARLKGRRSSDTDSSKVLTFLVGLIAGSAATWLAPIVVGWLA